MLRTKGGIKKFIIIFLTLFLLMTVFAVVYAKQYENRVLPNVYINGLPIGGMDKQQVKNFLQRKNDKLASEGISVSYKNSKGKKEQFNLSPIIVLGGGGNSIELIHFDINKESERLVNYKKGDNILTTIKNVYLNWFQKDELTVSNFNIDKQKLKEAIKENIKNKQERPKNAKIEIYSTRPLNYEVYPSSPGFVYNYEEVVDKIEKQWKKLQLPEVFVKKEFKQAEITRREVKSLAPTLSNALVERIEWRYNKNGREQRWYLYPGQLKNWIQPEIKQGKVTFGLVGSEAADFIKNRISSEVDKKARDAKFNIGSGKVRKFKPSSPGRRVNIGRNIKLVEKIISRRMEAEQPSKVTSTIQLAVEKIKPNISTEEVNDLGIKEKIGTGVSDFSGSPQERIHNIKIGVEKIDGTLIPPGEEFSAVETTKPYTKEAGYLPELVIKGERLKPEIGGGLCQLGTTLFRMAMESGMPITERRNHSLAVSYYTDPVNGLPGTDATLYNPKPDFRFKNNTENHVLIEAEMDAEKQKLYFTIWGTDDGRSASSYTHPKVSKWYKPGDKKVKETTDLPPGKTKCQKSYKGADASFTYKRVLPDGTTKERVFTSHYRPLPKICLKGVKKEDKEDDKDQ